MQQNVIMKFKKFKNSNIRTLFASTGVKGDELSPSYYVDNFYIQIL